MSQSSCKPNKPWTVQEFEPLRLVAWNLRQVKEIFSWSSANKLEIYIADLNTMKIARVTSLEEAKKFAGDNGDFTIARTD